MIIALVLSLNAAASSSGSNDQSGGCKVTKSGSTDITWYYGAAKPADIMKMCAAVMGTYVTP